ncbi:MAG: hypothetical protein H0U66_15230 [Gemmatimonadaceae bacterium]|nr:hypothetical protein [Gemmatimonadaceae bacterium]
MRFKTFLRSSLALVAVAAAFACADNAAPTAPHVTSAPSLAFSKATDGKKPKVAVCKLQKEEWKTTQIGSKGGEVKVGTVVLSVPAGALASNVAITAHVLPTTSASVQFLPEGLHFAVPATLRLEYTKCATPIFGVSVVYVQRDSVTEVEPSNNHPLLKFVTARISHFSSYAVAY